MDQSLCICTSHAATLPHGLIGPSLVLRYWSTGGSSLGNQGSFATEQTGRLHHGREQSECQDSGV